MGGTCQPSCTIIDGVDSCNPYKPDVYYSPPINPFCDSWTGACVQCLDDWGCTNVLVNQIDGLYAYPGFAASKCSSNGTCVGCSSDADCPATAPNCTEGFCGFCSARTVSVTRMLGSPCEQSNGSEEAGTCIVTGCVGDANFKPTDAGAICPTGTPFCAATYNYNNGYTTFNICAQCRPDYTPAL